jgi:heat-inducible transcriptional repressor
MSLTQREIEVLATIIHEYIVQAAPVGSRTVAKRSKIGLSPASIRNLMSDLTDKGFLEQPHTSAGRVPTARGFRFYVDRMVRLQPLSQSQRQAIVSQLDDSEADLSEILRRASKILSALSRQVSLVVAPNRAAARWKQIDFVIVRPGLVLAILLLNEGMMENKVIHVSQDITQDDLIRYRNYLNGLFKGRTISDVRAHIIREMKQAQEKFDALYRKALLLARKTFVDDERELFVDGTLNILNQPDFSDLSTLRELFKIVDERSKLLELLDKVTGEGGIKIVFGLETIEDIPYCGLISSPYGEGGDALGAVGIIGPLRMDYARMIPVVDYTAQMLTEVLKKRI